MTGKRNPRLDERVAFLEGKVEEHRHMVNGIREAVASLEHRTGRFEERVDRRFDGLDSKMGRQFTWLVGLLVTILIAAMTTLGATATALLTR